MKKLFFGTGNAHKLKEIREILGTEIQILSFEDLPEKLEVEETESTLQGNAALKAKAFYAATGMACFAEDTGLEVEALNGAPGVYSARYSGLEANAESNMAKLLTELAGASSRAAQFRTVVAYTDGTDMHFFEGILSGRIGTEKAGDMGFGYDPVFYPEGSTKSLGQTLPEAKNAISHRGKAIRAFAQFIQTQL